MESKISHEEVPASFKQVEFTQSQLIRQERLSALGQMASSVAHDFNNVLVPIIGYSDLLLSQPETLSEPKRALPMLQAIHDAAQTAQQAVKRLRYFYSSIEPTDTRRSASIDAIVDEAIEATRLRWQEEAKAAGIQIDIIKEVPDNLSVQASQNDLREALICLLHNAIDAMRTKSGSITIAACKANTNQVEICVRDTGCGMNEESLNRCLEPFFTTKGGHGTGLGLSMVYGILKRNHGSVSIKSDMGCGTTATLFLPLAVASEPPETPPLESGKVTPKRILVADDEALVRDVVKRFLALDGHTVHITKDGTEAIAAFEQDAFDLVILDRAMPGLNGDQVAAAIRAASSTPVVMLTGFGDRMIDANDVPEGVDMVLPKPVTIAELRRAIVTVSSPSP